jgi:peptidyl-prolyl cis-trans isomerase B (cyclophilin B)
MVLKNAPKTTNRTDRREIPDEEEKTLLERVLAYKFHIGFGILVVVLVALALAIYNGMKGAKDEEAWFRSKDLRQTVGDALLADRFPPQDPSKSPQKMKEDALREIESTIDEYQGTSVHPWLLFMQARLYHGLDRLQEAQKTLLTLQQEYPKHPFTNPDYFLKGDRPLSKVEADAVSARIAFEDKVGKPFSWRPKPHEGLSVTLKVKDFGDIKLGFFPDVAPLHVANFVKLARDGYFNGTTFHRITDFCIQGGDPNSKDDDPKNDGLGGPGWTVKKEIRFNPTLHTRGTLSAAATSTSQPDSGSQFYICTVDSEHLDGGYTPYGEVLEGLDIVDKIAQQPTKGQNEDGISPDRPVNNIVIEAATVEGDFTLPEEEMPGFLERKKKAEKEKADEAKKKANSKPPADPGSMKPETPPPAKKPEDARKPG